MRRKIKKIPEPTDSVDRPSKSTSRPNKRYGWLIFSIIFSWTILGLIFFNVPPTSLRDVPFSGSYLVVVICLFIALFLTLSLLFLSSRSGLLWSMAIILFFYFRLWGIGNMINFFLIFGVIICLEFYFRQIKNA
jgi:hypothetical protein